MGEMVVLETALVLVGDGRGEAGLVRGGQATLLGARRQRWWQQDPCLGTVSGPQNPTFFAAIVGVLLPFTAWADFGEEGTN